MNLKSFTRGKEYGGWFTIDGGVEMFPRGIRDEIRPQPKPQGATGFFHTHPNTGGSWLEIHSPADINFNNNYAQVPSLVIGRQNVYVQMPWQNATLFLLSDTFLNDVLLNVITGNFSALKKSSDLRCLSLISLSVLMLFTSTENSI